MNTVATSRRILEQLKADHRTVGMIIVVPALLMALIHEVYRNLPVLPGQQSLFERVGITMLGILPFVVMFLVTAITMQRERSSGTLERLMTMPLAKVELLAGYALAFSLAAAVQAAVACLVAFGLLGLTSAGGIWPVIVVAMVDAILGVALGLLASAFARTEFQAVQFMPIAVVPQLFLCGLLSPRAQLPGWLHGISDVLPLSYAVDALQRLATETATSTTWWDLLIVALFTLGALGLASATLRRRTA